VLNNNHNNNNNLTYKAPVCAKRKTSSVLDGDTVVNTQGKVAAVKFP